MSDHYSEPLAGCCHPGGSLEHAIQEAPGPWPGTVTRRSLCGVRGASCLRNFGRYFDPLQSESGRKLCPKCIAAFLPWWAERVALEAEQTR